MDTTQIEIIQALATAKTGQSLFAKNFVSNLNNLVKTSPNYVLTSKQIEWLYRLLYKYRKQLKSLYQQHHTNPLCAKKTNQLNIFL